jgi:integrase
MIRVTQTAAGDVRYKVRFRLNGMQTSQTFDTEEEAAEFIQLGKDLKGWDNALKYTLRRDASQVQQALTLDRWFPEYQATLSGIESRTFADYGRVYERHIKPHLGSMPIDMIDRKAVATFVNALAKTKIQNGKGKTTLSAKTIANAHGILAAALNEAVLSGKIQANPCKGTRLPRSGEVERIEERYLTHEEYNRLEDELPERWVPLVRTLVGTGMRWSEATALRVAEVDLDGLPTIKIIRATKWTPGEGHHDGVPKTKKSRRTIIVPAPVVEVLRPLLKDKEGDEYVFTAARGGQVRHSGFHRLVWTPTVAKAKIKPPPRIHDLRHTFASWAIEMGIGLEAIQDQLGHESILTTRKIYGHLQPAMREALMVAMGQALAIGRPALPT